MTLTVSAHELGTPEREWLACAWLSAAPAADWPAARRVVVVAPHPDDEVLGVGGILHVLARAGSAVTVVAVTDGEGSHPHASHVAPEDLAIWRAAERSAALARLGIDAQLVRMRAADGAVAALEASLVAPLAAVLENADLCLAPWQHDGHPDHDACGRVAIRACAAAGVRLWQYPIWAWHWARAGAADLPRARARRVSLPRAAQAAKSAAIAAYRTQIEPLGPHAGEEAILPAAVLARFRRPFEVVFV